MAHLIAFVSQTGNVMKTTLAAATAIELIKNEVATVALDLDREHRLLGSLSTWAKDRRTLQPHKDQLEVLAPNSAEEAAALIHANTSDPDIYLLDCPSRAGQATAQIAAAVDLVVFPIVPGKKDLHLSLHTIHGMIALGVDPKRIAIVLTRCQTAFEIDDMRAWLQQNSPHAQHLTFITPALEEKVAYRNAIARGLAITEVSPVRLRSAAAAAIGHITHSIIALTTQDPTFEDAAA